MCFCKNTRSCYLTKINDFEKQDFDMNTNVETITNNQGTTFGLRETNSQALHPLTNVAKVPISNAQSPNPSNPILKERIKELKSDVIARAKAYKYFVENSDNMIKIEESTWRDDKENRLALMKDFLRTASLADKEPIQKLLEAFPLDELILLHHFYTHLDKWQVYLDELENWSILFNRDQAFGSYLSKIIEQKQKMYEA